jgi:hypothetical protein
MAQSTTFGDAEVDTLLKVKKADGSMKYFQVVKNQNVEISEEEYKERGGE